jgi:hypothetical protein
LDSPFYDVEHLSTLAETTENCGFQQAASVAPKPHPTD